MTFDRGLRKDFLAGKVHEIEGVEGAIVLNLEVRLAKYALNAQT